MLPPRVEAALKILRARLPRLSPEQRIKAAQTISDIEWTLENEPIRFFIPHGGQAEFIKLLDHEALFCGSGAGNGWGKSEVLVAILTAALWPQMAPAALKVPLLMDWAYPKQARIYSTPAELAENGSLQTAIARLFPKGRYTSHKGGYGYPSVFVTDSGWTLDLFSYERPAKEAAGPNIGFQIFNEPPPQDLWTEAVARTRAGGIIVGGMTSLDDNPWIVGDVFDKADGKSIRMRYGNSCENCKTHGVNGNLEHSRIMAILDQIRDPAEREARFSGKPLSLSGRIFRTFDPAIHVITPIERVPPGTAVYQVVDPAGGKPFAIIWAYVDKTGTLTVFDEWPNDQFAGAKDPGLNIQDYVSIFQTKEAGFKVQSRIMDRRYGNTSHKPGSLTLRQDFAEPPHNIEFLNSYSVGEDKPEVQTGILKVLDYLHYDKSKPVDSVNRPKLFITSNCRNTIESVQKWMRDPKTLKPKDDHFKDFSDCLRYLTMANPEVEESVAWVQPSGPHYGVNT